MKQLKIVSTDYNQKNGGLINVNFNETILVEPNATIAMDKFSMDVQGVSTNIEIPDQIVDINTNYGVNTSRPAIVRAGKYPTISNLLAEMNTAFNSILNTDDLNSAENTPTDNGLFFLNFIDPKTQHVAMGFGSLAIDFTSENWTLVNLTSNIVEGNVELSAYNAGLYSLLTGVPVVKGGVDVGLTLRYDNNSADHTFKYGLFDSSDNELLLYGIEKVGSNFYYVNKTNSVLIPSTHFIDHPDYVHQFFVAEGKLRYQIYGDDKEFIYGLPAGAFDGFSFNSTYYFQILGNNTLLTGAPTFINVGICYQSGIDINTFGVFWDYDSFTSKKYLKRFPLVGVTPERTILYDFTPSPILQNGLGFSAVIYDVGPALNLSIVAEKTVKFDTFYQLALQIPSVQLESYIAYSASREGTRQNNICYFTPQKSSQTNKSVYVWENYELVFVSLSNKQPINLNSMQFRIIDVATRQPVDAESLSFNLYIQEKALI
tara:strand:- start:1360 stop:2820 length:1461 start_codon:yes stop_codon:yes gene_type:complete